MSHIMYIDKERESGTCSQSFHSHGTVPVARQPFSKQLTVVFAFADPRTHSKQHTAGTVILVSFELKLQELSLIEIIATRTQIVPDMPSPSY